MHLLSLPHELLDIIIGYLDSQKDLNSLAQVNHHLHTLINVRLYRYNLTFDNGLALGWAARTNQTRTAKHLFDLGVKKQRIWVNVSLCVAALYDSREMVELLLKEGADPNAGILGQAAPWEAVLAGHPEWANQLTYGAGWLTFWSVNEVTPLHAAAAKGHAAVVELLLDYGAKINALNSNHRTHLACAINWDRDYRTPLACAINWDRGETFSALFDHGAKLHLRENGNDASFILHEVVKRGGGANIVKVLLAKGFNPDLPDSRGDRPLTLAMQSGVRIGRALLEGGANANYRLRFGGTTALGKCLTRKNQEFAKLLLEFGANPSDGYGGYRPVHRAARYGLAEVIRCLIDKGAEIEARDRNGETPLFHARDEESIRALLTSGADVNATNSTGSTPLHSAARYGLAEVIRCLIDKGARVRARDINNETPLFLAIRARDEESVRTLLTSGANVNAINSASSTPLHTAAGYLYGSARLVKCLIDNRARVRARDINGETPLFLAIRAGDKESVRTLITSGANVNATNSTGSTPLHAAARRGFIPVVKCLIENGARARARDINGETPLFPAIRAGDEESVWLLLQRGCDPNTANRRGVTAVKVAQRQGRALILRLVAPEKAKELKERRRKLS